MYINQQITYMYVELINHNKQTNINYINESKYKNNN